MDKQGADGPTPAPEAPRAGLVQMEPTTLNLSHAATTGIGRRGSGWIGRRRLILPFSCARVSDDQFDPEHAAG